MESDRARALTGLALALVLTATGGLPAPAQTALVSLDWLSDSVSPAAMPREGTGDQPVSKGALPDPVTVQPLDGPRPDAVGLFAAQDAGLPADLWSGSSSARIDAQLARMPVETLPALRRLLKDMLLSEAEPPEGGDGRSLFLARVDTLLRFGDVEAARQLVNRAGGTDPEVFRRGFDAAILTGTESSACNRMLRLPEIAPTYSARVFCLARSGDWRAAALTLETGEALEVIGEAEETLLARFLDAEIAANGLALPPPRQPTPLVFAMLDAIGEPLATPRLPLAFAHFDLRPQAGWRQRVAAAERLARVGAIVPERLIEVYTERQSPASGQVWDRIDAVQALLAALDSGDAAATAEALPPAWDAMRSAGLAVPFAATVAEPLAAMDLPPALDDTRRDIELLTDRYALTASAIADAGGPLPCVVRLALGQPAAADADDGPLAQALHDGLTTAAPPERLVQIAAEGREGEALLIALSEIHRGAEGDLDALASSLAYLREAGLRHTARRAAVEILLLGVPK